VIGDGDRILQIVGNILDNAMRWTPEGTTVTVSLTAGGGFADVCVADRGPGVPLAQREAIFRPFVTNHESGTGLGLSVAAELAAAMGGRLLVDDRPGGGAMFTLRLPLAPHGGEPGPAAGQPTAGHAQV
jgi:signal transduction histidine kinase